MLVPWEPSTLFQQPFPNRAENSWKRQDSSLPTRDISYLPCSIFTVYPLLGHTPSGWVRLTKTWVRVLADMMTDESILLWIALSLSVPSQHRWSVPHFINLPCRTMQKTVWQYFYDKICERRKGGIFSTFLQGGSLLSHSLGQLHLRAVRNFCVVSQSISIWQNS